MQFANIDDLTVIANEIKKKANTTDLGTAAAANTTNSVTQGSGDLPTAGAVWTAIDNLPEPMIMKGTLGTGGTITSLPTASASNEGFVYKVITAGTYAGQAAVVGDFFVSCKPEGASDYSWVWFPSGDESFSDTWRNIKVNGTEKLGTGISSGAVDFVDGTNTTVAFDTNGNKVSVSVPAVSSANAGVAPKGNAVSSQDQNTKFLREDGTWAKPSYTTDTNTHRPIQVNDTQVLGDNTTPLDLKAGSNVTISADGGNVTISAQDTTYSDATTSASGLMSASDKTKLDGVASGAEVNQNAFSNVKVGETTIVADNKTDTLELVAGSNVTITPDAINDKLTISAQDTTYSDATTSASGLMSASDKTKLDGIANGATKTAVSSVNGKVKINDVDTLVYDDTELQNKTATDDVSIEGNPLSFETGYSQYSKSTLIDLEPIQDLHGYDKPWVGGAGKNKLPITLSNIKSINIAGTWSGNSYTLNGITFTVKTDSDDNVIGIATSAGTPSANASFELFTASANFLPNGSYILNGCPSGGGGTKYKVDIADTSLGVIYAADYGSSATFDSSSITSSNIHCRIVLYSATTQVAMTFYPMIRLSTESDATFQPYTNIASISGRSEIGILGYGANILNPNWAIAQSGSVSVLVNGETVTASCSGSGNYEAVKWNKGTTDSDNFTAGTYYIKLEVVSATNYSLGTTFGFRKRNGNQRVDSINITQSGTYTKQVTITEDCYLSLVLNGTGASALANQVVIKNIMVSTIDKDFEPYTKSNDLTIQLGQTVYGGTLDVENGVLVVDKVIVDLGSVNFNYEYKTDNKWFTSSNITSSVKIPVDNNEIIDVISSQYYKTSRNILVNDLTVNGYVAINVQGNILVRDLRYTDASTFKTAMDGVQLCYPLATPITIQLTPNEISLLEGVNNISTTADGIKLTYRNGKFATLDGAVPKMTFRGEDYTMGVDDIGLFLKNLTKSTKTYIANPLLNFDGTVATYKKIMKQWFINNGVNIMDSTGITYLCEKWYEITKQGWKGGTSFPAVGVSTGSTGTRFDDNVGMSVTPSTDTSANTDTYQGLPLFAITDCNWELDSDGNILITAIDGITDNFVRDDPTKFVGVMQQTGWVKKVDDASTQKYYYADDKDAYEDLVPLPEAIKLDGTVRSFVVHAKYMSGIVDSKMTCCSGIIPRRNISHDSLVTLPDNIGTQYSGGTSVDWSFLVWMQRIKYASLTSDGVLQGCCNYNYQYYVKVSETGVKRLILSSANGANLKVGSTVTFGAYAGNADRGQAATYSISGQDGAIITAIEDVTIDSTTYKAIYVDTTSTFDTVANGDATNGTTIVSTHHWVSGSCDNVKGNDGSPVSATNGVYPAKLQGIEYMVGGYEVFADVIMNISGGYYNPYYARKSTDQATSITSSMVQSTLKCAQPSSDVWRYIQKHGFDGEIFYPVSTGTSSSEYMKDGFYEKGTGTTTGNFEWLAFGALGNGSGNAGLSCLGGNLGLSNGWWYCLARLSPNGNRGELAA